VNHLPNYEILLKTFSISGGGFLTVVAVIKFI